MAKVAESGKTPDFRYATVPHILTTHYFLRLTRARGVSFQREGNALFDDFCRAFGHSKARKEEKFFNIKTKIQVPSTAKIKDFCPTRFFFCKSRRKRKSYQKEKRRKKISRSAERDKGDLPLTSAPSPKGARKLQFGGRKL